MCGISGISRTKKSRNGVSESPAASTTTAMMWYALRYNCIRDLIFPVSPSATGLYRLNRIDPPNPSSASESILSISANSPFRPRYSCVSVWVKTRRTTKLIRKKAACAGIANWIFLLTLSMRDTVCFLPSRLALPFSYSATASGGSAVLSAPAISDTCMRSNMRMSISSADGGSERRLPAFSAYRL